MSLQPVSANINHCKKAEVIANHLPTKHIRRDIGPSLLLIHSHERIPIPYINSCVKNLVPQAITYSDDKPNTTNAFNPQSKISNLSFSTITHQPNANESSAFEMTAGGAPPDSNQLLIQKAKNKNKIIDWVIQQIEL